MKDKLTGKTHDERVAERKARAEQEKKEYDEYLRRRGEMLRAVNQGQYRTAYSAPQGPYRVQPMYGGRYGGGMYGGGMYGRGMYGGRGYGYYPAGPMGIGNGVGMMGRGPGMGMAMGGGLLGACARSVPFSSLSLLPPSSLAQVPRLTRLSLSCTLAGGLLLGDMLF